MGYTIAKVLDRGVIEVVGPFGISEFLFKTGKNISKWDTGIVTSYALYIVLGLISMLFLLFAPIILNTLPFPSGNGVGGDSMGIDSDIFNYVRLLFIYMPCILFIMLPTSSNVA